jgi:hypothetical protein
MRVVGMPSPYYARFAFDFICVHWMPFLAGAQAPMPKSCRQCIVFAGLWRTPLFSSSVARWIASGAAGAALPPYHGDKSGTAV